MTTACITFDFDALSIWISTFKLTSSTPFSRGEYAANVGMPRVLAMLERCGVEATFFVPAHTARSFPEMTRQIVERGHEVACHGLIHESPVGLEPQEERRLLDESIAILTDVTGVRPQGYRSPAWDLSQDTIKIIEAAGLLYDSSLMADDFRPYYPRINDLVTEEKLIQGAPGRVLEFPVAWELDDYPYFQFTPRPLYQGLRLPGDVYQAWAAEFDCAHEQSGVFTLTCHPEIIGRGPRIKMLEQLIRYMQSHDGVTFSSMGRVARRLRAE
ncbi:polysaccharide deacetylase family protein [Pseudomonas putida]